MQLLHSTSSALGSSCSTRRSRTSQLHVRAQAPLSGSTAGASSNSTGTSSLPPLSFDRPAGGGSRSFDLPRSSDLNNWSARPDLLRPSGGASRGAAFATGSGEGGAGSSIDRPGGRGGRSDMPSGWDVPSNPQDPAYGRPGGRGGRDSSLSSIDGGSSGSIDRPGGRGGRDSSLSSIDQPSSGSIERPGGRGGRDNALSSIDKGDSAPSIDRPGGRGGRDGPPGGDGGSGGSGGSGDGSSGGSSGGEEGGSGFGKGIGGVALYAGVIVAAWFGHKALYPEKQVQAPPPVKPCCAGKKKK
jgi:hypothetical protein